MKATIAIFVLIWAACSTAVAAARPLHVYAVHYPLYFMADRIAGDTADVIFPVPKNQDPAQWRPPLSALRAMQKADLILFNGANYARWIDKVALPRSRKVNTSQSFSNDYIRHKAVTHTHGPKGAHSHTRAASITWLDFAQAMRQAAAIAHALGRRRPKDKPAFTARLATLQQELKALDTRARHIGNDARGIAFVSGAQDYAYFARAYGLTMTSLDWHDDEQPSTADWARLTRIGEQASRIIYLWGAAPGEDAMRRLEQRGIGSIVFKTAANRVDEDFIATMRANLAALAHAIRSPL